LEGLATRAAVLFGVGNMRVEDVKDPDVGGGNILIRVRGRDRREAQDHPQ
jgi:hypothetical protein